MEDGFCAQRIHYRARDARLAPKEVPAVLYYGFAGCRSHHVDNVAQFSVTGVRRLIPHIVYDIEPADGNKRSPNNKVAVPRG